MEFFLFEMAQIVVVNIPPTPKKITRVMIHAKVVGSHRPVGYDTFFQSSLVGRINSYLKNS